MVKVIDQVVTNDYAIYNADCVDSIRDIESNSIGFSVYSPPFESLYTYSNSDRDMGNSANTDQFWDHYRYLIAEQYRTMMPGRLVAIHCMNLPTSKLRDGYIGIRDFRGEIIRAFQDAGFIYHSEVCIWKDPVVAQQRTKAIGLLHKTLEKDSAMSRQGIPDYLVVMRKPGDNPEPISGRLTVEQFAGENPPDCANESDQWQSVMVWQRYASPVWMDINQTRTLQYRDARDNDDERHICPLQLDVIERAMQLWSNPGDTVLTPFLGIGSEAYVAVKMDRKAIGFELKPSYFEIAKKNVKQAVIERNQYDLFGEAV